jgi:hypothetical protein
MKGSQACGLLNHRSREFNPEQVELSKKGIEMLKAGPITSPQRPHPAFQNTEPADCNRQRWIGFGKFLECLLYSAAPSRVTLHQVDQGTGIEKGDHQSRSAASSASIAALLRGRGAGGKLSSQCKLDGAAAGAREA